MKPLIEVMEGSEKQWYSNRDMILKFMVIFLRIKMGCSQMWGESEKDCN